MARSALVQATAVLSLFASSVFADVVEYTMNVANGQVAPDGITRNAVLVNGRFPGPLLKANKGDILKVTVNNQLTDSTMRRSTAVHWHGLFQAGTAEEDGPAFVTQCPIAPQASYTYNVPLKDQAGTFWYHSHLSSQYVDGLRGPLVIYPNDPYRSKYDVDDETTVLTLADWYHSSSEEIVASGNVLRTIPDSGTINGKGRYGLLNVVASPDSLYTLKVQRGKRYRLRIINASAIMSNRFGIEGHKMTIIEMDGISTKPMEVDQLDILAGQRYSVIINANQKPDTYWINAPVTNVPNTNVQALLVYEDVKQLEPPKNAFWTWNVSQDIIQYWKHEHGHHRQARKMRRVGASRGVFGIGSTFEERVTSSIGNQLEKRIDATALNPVVVDETKLVPLENPGAPGGSRPADVVVPLNFDLNFLSGKWRINGQSYAPPDVPTLLKILSKQGNITNTDLYGKITRPLRKVTNRLTSYSANSEMTYTLPKGKVVELVFGGHSLGISHPFHLHGVCIHLSIFASLGGPELIVRKKKHTFDVVQFGSNPPNYVNPPRRDVVGVLEPGTRIRFKTDNPGPWFLHCHIDWHLEEGLAVVFAEAPSDIPKVVKPDPSWYSLCEKYEKLPKELQ
ncbi:laccase [Ceratobasidium sp. 392]|nr:laccase [Ceratobasidium sp. 392]